MENEKKVCCLCGREVTGWGNNPWPISTEGLCCDECNANKVIPERMLLLTK